MRKPGFPEAAAARPWAESRRAQHEAAPPPASPAAPTVFIVDDDPLVLRVMGRLLRVHGFEACTFDSAEAFLAQSDASAPGCLVLDVRLPGLDGLALQRRLAGAGPAPPIVFLTGHGDIPMSVQAVKAGAVDFLTKPVATETLLAAVRAGLAQDARARQVQLDTAALRRRYARLTERECEVLACLAAGQLNKQIAGDLGIALATVKFHRARIMERMQARTVAELMHLAARLEPAPAANPSDPASEGPGPASSP
jgi:FixJ family two-component response regulator